MEAVLAVSPSFCAPAGTLGASSAVATSCQTSVSQSRLAFRPIFRRDQTVASAAATQFFAGVAPGALKLPAVSSSRSSSDRSAVRGPRCMAEGEGSSGSSVDTWLGRVAMLGFTGALAVEVVTGKGVLENVGLSAPIPALALVVAAAAGGITAFGIFRSASEN